MWLNNGIGVFCECTAGKEKIDNGAETRSRRRGAYVGLIRDGVGLPE